MGDGILTGGTDRVSTRVGMSTGVGSGWFTARERTSARRAPYSPSAKRTLGVGHELA